MSVPLGLRSFVECIVLLCKIGIASLGMHANTMILALRIRLSHSMATDVTWYVCAGAFGTRHAKRVCFLLGGGVPLAI